MKINEAAFKTVNDLTKVTSYFMKNVNRIITPLDETDRHRVMIVLIKQMIDEWQDFFKKDIADSLSLLSGLCAVMVSAGSMIPKNIAIDMASVLNDAIHKHLEMFYKDEGEKNERD